VIFVKIVEVKYISKMVNEVILVILNIYCQIWVKFGIKDLKVILLM
jgi:hypothetical protein